MGKQMLFLALMGLVASVFAATASGTLESGSSDSIWMDGLRFYVDDIEFGSQNAVVSLRDSDDNVLAVEEIAEGRGATMSAGGRNYLVFVNKTAQGTNFVAKWAMLTISPGPALLNVGDTENFGGVLIKLEDIERDTRSASLMVMEDGDPIYKEEVKEGSYVVREIGGQRYKISVTQTSIGFNFISKWARVSVEPTSLAESPNDYPALNVGEVMEEDSLKVRLDDIERDTGAALVSILDSDGNVLSQDEIPVGGNIIRTAEDGQKYQIRAHATMPGYNFVGKWAKLTATPTSFAETKNYPTISLGEGLSEGSATVTLDDIARDTSAALLTLDDGTNTYRESVLPGRYVIRTLGGQRYKIRVYQTAPGLNFIAKWAKVTIEPTTLRESTTYAGSSVIFVGESAEGPDGNMRVRLDDIERDTNYAIVSVLDSSDNVVWQDEIRSGGYIIVPVDGTRYLIRSYETAPGLNFIAKWARVSVQKTTLTKALPAGEAINVGEVTDCAGGEYRIRLDDIERDSRDAIITVLDSSDKEVLKDKIPDGQAKSFQVDGGTCTAKVTATAPGLNFIAKWARLSTN